MKKQIKQSTACNIMAITSCSMALFIFLCGAFTAFLFAKVTDLNSVQAELSGEIRRLITTVNYQKDMSRSFTQEGNSMYLDMYNKEAVEARQIDSILANIAKLTADANGQLQLQGIIQNVDTMKAMEQDVIGLVQSGKMEAAQAVAFGRDYGMLLDGLNQAVDGFEEGMKRGIGAIIGRQSDNIMTLGISIEILCVLLVAMQVFNAATLKRHIIKPLIKLKDGMVEMCGGSLSGSVDVRVDQTEMGQLAGAMLNMKSKISSYIQEINFVLRGISHKDISVQVRNEYVGDFKPIHESLDLITASLSETFSTLGLSIDKISSGAGHVSSVAQALAQGATEQTGSVEQLSSSISQVSAQIKSNATSATEANQLAVTAGANLHASSQQMSMMVDAMTEINASSAEIGKIIKTIEDIAFQTDILALNAAVEAARAGTAGKGFAVVADEVRNLATKSSAAAKQTNALIEKSVKSVQNGVEIANETARSLSEAVGGSNDMADLITKIFQSSGEQSLSIAQINQGVDQISSVVQINSTTSKQSASASEELFSQSNIMKQMVNAYKLKADRQGVPQQDAPIISVA